MRCAAIGRRDARGAESEGLIPAFALCLSACLASSLSQYMPGRWNHVPANEDPLERLARLAATDKQWGLHKYTDVYASLFHNMRNDRVNLTEVGVLHGASVVMWASYFRNGNIYGLDPFAVPAIEAARPVLRAFACTDAAMRHEKAALERSRSAQSAATSRATNIEAARPVLRAFLLCDAARQLRDEARLVPNSMDIVIEDGPHIHANCRSSSFFPDGIYWPLVGARPRRQQATTFSRTSTLISAAKRSMRCTTIVSRHPCARRWRSIRFSLWTAYLIDTTLGTPRKRVGSV